MSDENNKKWPRKKLGKVCSNLELLNGEWVGGELL